MILGLSSLPFLRILKVRAQDIVISKHGDSVNRALTDNPDLIVSDRPLGFLDKLEEWDILYF